MESEPPHAPPATATPRAPQRPARAPRAKAAQYSARSEVIVVHLDNGATFAFPPHLVPGLAGASPEQLAEVEPVGGGTGLHWAALDTGHSIDDLLDRVFGTARRMAARGGRSRSPEKAAAARANGAKGGRPRRAG